MSLTTMQPTVDPPAQFDGRRPSSRIQRLVRNGSVVFEKQYLPDDWGGTEYVIRERAKREVSLLQLLHESKRFQPPLGLVRIESHDPLAAQISTFEIEGSSLDEWIHDRSAKRSSQLVRAMQLAGAWLKQFQLVPIPATDACVLSEYDPESLSEYCGLRLDTLSNYGFPPFRKVIRDRLLARLESLQQDSSTDDHKNVWVHADYAPGNLLWDGTILTPIDFAMARHGRPLDDVTYLIHRLEMQKVYRPWLRWPLTTWRAAILDGFGRPDAAASPMYQALMIKHLICRIHTYARRPARNLKQSLHDSWVRRVLRNKLIKLAG